jgi:pyrimidine operon attenuation protein/uracil phosphoribosyltransferase
MPTSLPTPEQLIDQLARAIAPVIHDSAPGDPPWALVGIHTGGVWVMDGLMRRLGADLPRGVLDIAFYRDDFSRIGLHPQVKPSSIPFEVEGCRILLIDDVLYTGRTIRAAMNLLFDYGRPAAIKLAVLVDRGGRELPLCADFVGANLNLAADEHISLNQNHDGVGLHFAIQQR